MDNMIWIKNIPNTSDSKPPLSFDAWIDFYNAKAKKKAAKGLVGGHVWKIDTKDPKHKRIDPHDHGWYIAAITDVHNHSTNVVPYKYFGELVRIHPKRK